MQVLTSELQNDYQVQVQVVLAAHGWPRTYCMDLLISLRALERVTSEKLTRFR